MVTWTKELHAAAAAIARDFSRQDESRRGLAADVRERATELERCAKVGAELKSFQVEVVSQFRQRLADPYLSFAGAEAFESAWAAAWSASA